MYGILRLKKTTQHYILLSMDEFAQTQKPSSPKKKLSEFFRGFINTTKQRHFLRPPKSTTRGPNRKMILRIISTRNQQTMRCNSGFILKCCRILELKDATVRFWDLKEVGTLPPKAGPR